MSDAQQPRAKTLFDTQAFLGHLDALFARKAPAREVEAYLVESLEKATQSGDQGAQLTIVNELIGFFRSQSMHAKGIEASKKALALVETMNLAGSQAATTTLINVATEYRAAGDYEHALTLYQEALVSSEHTLPPLDRKLAALHNNLSIVYSDLQKYDFAEAELKTALRILTDGSPQPATDMDIGSTHANLALVYSKNGKELKAQHHITTALQIFADGKHTDASHYSATLAAAGETFFEMGEFQKSADMYQSALTAIEQAYGTSNDYYTTTAHNLKNVIAAAEAAGVQLTHTPPSTHQSELAEKKSSPLQASRSITGLELSKKFWETYGKPLLETKYPEAIPRIAVGLVGHGSEAYGFDDEFSHDHDFAPRFCLWLTAQDYEAFGEKLQADYENLPHEFMGFEGTQSQQTPRSQGLARRSGVFPIPDFYSSITGFVTAPSDDPRQAAQWLILDEATLAAATNGQIFADPLGAFSRERRLFKAMPSDVRLSLISRRLGMLSQAGQYNFPRMLARKNSAGAWRALNEFVHACSSLVFLINGPSTVGYLPYYKWEMAALQRISERLGTRLSEVAALLQTIMQLASPAAYPDASRSSLSRKPLGDYSTLHSAQADTVMETITTICKLVVDELKREKLTPSSEHFLEWQRPYVEEGIQNPQLKSLKLEGH